MSVTASTPIDLSSVVESREPLEAVLLITRTGTQLGTWTRNSVPVDVLSVMAATLVGSIETWMAARATTGDIPMRAGNVGSARLAGERLCDCSAITVITAVLTFPEVSIARA